MAALFQSSNVLGIPVLPTRRVIAIDPGSHSLKFILAESSGRRFRVLKKKTVDLAGEGLVSPEEIGGVVQSSLREWGDYPVVLALPAHLPMSQLIDLGPGNADGVKQLIERESLKNRDMHDSPIVYDCQKLLPFGKHQNSFWVTLCKEKDIFSQISRLSLNAEDVGEVVSGGNALAAAYSRLVPQAKPSVLVDFGASNTEIVIVVEGQAVHASSFAIGGNLVTEAIATEKKCSLETAENLKRTQNLLSGEGALSSVLSLFQSWKAEIERAIRDWQRENPEMKGGLPVVVCGGSARQMGLIELVNRETKHTFSLWPNQPESESSPQYSTVFGAAWQTLRSGRVTGALMPADLRENCSKRRVHQRILSLSFLVLMLTAVLLVAGTAQKISYVGKKQELLELAETAVEKTKMTSSLGQQAVLTYERLRPILKRKQQTYDALTTLSLLGDTRTNRNLWYVLVADSLSYFTGQTTSLTNAFLNTLPVTNAPKYGIVAELCINEEGEARRRILGQVVTDLKQNPIFLNVDTLPVDRRKNLANPKVVLPERYFALSLELAGDEFMHSVFPVEVLSKTPRSTIPMTSEASRASETNRLNEDY